MKEIKGKSFVVNKLPFRRARPLFQHIVRSLRAVGTDTPSVTAFAAMDDAAMLQIQNDLGACSTCDGAPLNADTIDRVFSELGVAAYFEWIAFSIEVQFSDFLGEGHVEK